MRAVQYVQRPSAQCAEGHTRKPALLDVNPADPTGLRCMGLST